LSQAVDIICEGFGTQFDPVVVHAFHQCIDDFAHAQDRFQDGLGSNADDLIGQDVSLNRIPSIAEFAEHSD
jgi:hypothetical protein